MAEETHHLPLKRAESAAAFVLVVQAIAGLVAWLLSRLTHSAAAEAEAWHLVAGILVWLAALVHQRLRRMADEEAHTVPAPGPAKDRKRPETPLFEADETSLFSARSRLEQFETYFLPAFSILILLALGGLSFYLLRSVIVTPAPRAVEEPLMAFWFFIGIAFVSFLLARYTAGLAVQPSWRPLRPGADYSMSCAVGSLLVSLALVVQHFGVQVAERVLAYAIPALLGLLALEILLNLVLSLYRPRTAGEEVRPAHDSRLLGMLTTARGILRTTAETLDYQFGFKVSETWFFRFMERALAPLILFQLVTLYLLTSFVIVGSGEQAVIEFLGQPRHGRTPLGPGMHLKWPWPIEIAYRTPVSRVEVLTVGEQLKEDVEGYLWTVSHSTEPFYLLVANREEQETLEPKTTVEPEAETVPVSMLSGGVRVYYTISDLYDYLYNYEDAKGALSAVCYRELTRYAVSADFFQFLGTQRGAALDELKTRFQTEADKLKLGVQIVAVGLQGIHPPTQAGEAFEDVVGAMEDRETEILNAETYRNELLPDAEAKAERLRLEAGAYSQHRKLVAPAVAERFRKQLDAYKKAPTAFLTREYLSALEESLAGWRKYVSPVWGRTDEIIILNLEDKLLPGFGVDLGTPETQEGTKP